MGDYVAKFLDWVNKQLAYAKSAWAIAVIVASILGYNLTLEKKEPDPKPDTPVVAPKVPKIHVPNE